MANVGKIIPNPGPVMSLDPSSYVPEDIMDDNSEADTLMPVESRSKSNKIKVHDTRIYKPIRVHEYDDDEDEVRIEEPEEDFIDDRFEEAYIQKAYGKHKRHKYSDNGNKRKNELYRNIIKAKKKGYVDVPDVTPRDDIRRLESIESDVTYNTRKKNKVTFLWNAICIFCYLFERLVSKIGYGIRFNGWSEEVRTRKEEYMDYIDTMVADTIMIDKVTGERLVIKNKSFMSNFDVNPAINIIFALVTSAVRYTGASRFYRVADNLNKGMYDEEQLYANAKVPDSEGSDSEDED